ncbi:MAG: hypothetical protein L0H83_13335 [Salinisphaera sp.]|nr:hypothetical protein [Salinisphaera sp.]
MALGVGVVFLTLWFQLSRRRSNHLVEMLYQSEAGQLGFIEPVSKIWTLA